MTSPTGLPAPSAPRGPVSLFSLAEAGQQPGWLVLDTARAQQFTGEISFATVPAISVYFDSGAVYQATREGDPSLCDRLVHAAVVVPAQLERGVIRVGNVENLGRLFDRDPSIDRDAVMVVLELATDEVVTMVAGSDAVDFTPTAYRHHASGVHRWFVAPSHHDETAPAERSLVNEVAPSRHGDQPETSGLAAVSMPIDDGVHIEWDEPSLDPDPVAQRHPGDDGMQLLVHDSELSVHTEPSVPAWATEPAPAFVPPQTAAQTVLKAPVAVEARPTPLNAAASVAPPLPAPTLAAPPVPGVATEVLVAADERAEIFISDDGDLLAEAQANLTDEFQIVWPDGSEQPLSDTAGVCASSDTLDTIESAAGSNDIDKASEVFPLPTPDTGVNEQSAVMVSDSIRVTDSAGPSVAATGDPDPLLLGMPPLAVTGAGMPEEQQPEEVVDAVRRALDAIEAASVASAHLPPVDVVDLPSFEPTPPRPADVGDAFAAEPTAQGPAPVAVTSRGFAPPTMHDSAEAVYARVAQNESVTAGPASGIASVVFVDEEPSDDDDRSSALKRLIGSLRRK